MSKATVTLDDVVYEADEFARLQRLLNKGNRLQAQAIIRRAVRRARPAPVNGAKAKRRRHR